MKLVFPTMAYKEQAIEYINEFKEYGSEVNGSGALDSYLEEATYEDWIAKVLADVDIANVQKPRVPALTYFYVREEDNKVVGVVNIRLALNDFLRTEGGHIGYSIRPTERRKHYATEMLKEAVAVCNTVGIREVLVTCDKINVASAKVIRNAGGELEEEFYSEIYKEVVQRYVIRK